MARIEGVMVDGTCCRGQTRNTVLRAAEIGGISRGVESFDATEDDGNHCLKEVEIRR